MNDLLGFWQAVLMFACLITTALAYIQWLVCKIRAKRTAPVPVAASTTAAAFALLQEAVGKICTDKEIFPAGASPEDWGFGYEMVFAMLAERNRNANFRESDLMPSLLQNLAAAFAREQGCSAAQVQEFLQKMPQRQPYLCGLMSAYLQNPEANGAYFAMVQTILPLFPSYDAHKPEVTLSAFRFASVLPEVLALVRKAQQELLSCRQSKEERAKDAVGMFWHDLFLWLLLPGKIVCLGFVLFELWAKDWTLLSVQWMLEAMTEDLHAPHFAVFTAVTAISLLLFAASIYAFHALYHMQRHGVTCFCLTAIAETQLCLLLACLYSLNGYATSVDLIAYWSCVLASVLCTVLVWIYYHRKQRLALFT